MELRCNHCRTLLTRIQVATYFAYQCMNPHCKSERWGTIPAQPHAPQPKKQE